MSIHEHLPPQARREIKEVVWSKGLELAKLARRDRQEFDCATWLHKAREMPKEEFKQEVGAGRKSRRWSTLKKLYNRGVFYRVMLPVFFIPLNIARRLAVDLSRFRNPMKRYRAYKQCRGMSIMRDWIDWIGGWPYEFAAAEQVADFCKSRGFEMLTCNKSGWVLGNNEFVFERLGKHPASP